MPKLRGTTSFNGRQVQLIKTYYSEIRNSNLRQLKLKKNVLKVNVEHKTWNNVVMRVNLFCSCVRHIETHQKKNKTKKKSSLRKKGDNVIIIQFISIDLR